MSGPDCATAGRLEEEDGANDGVSTEEETGCEALDETGAAEDTGTTGEASPDDERFSPATSGAEDAGTNEDFADDD